MGKIENRNNNFLSDHNTLSVNIVEKAAKKRNSSKSLDIVSFLNEKDNFVLQIKNKKNTKIATLADAKSIPVVTFRAN